MKPPITRKGKELLIRLIENLYKSPVNPEECGEVAMLLQIYVQGKTAKEALAARAQILGIITPPVPEPVYEDGHKLPDPKPESIIPVITEANYQITPAARLLLARAK